MRIPSTPRVNGQAEGIVMRDSETMRGKVALLVAPRPGPTTTRTGLVARANR